MVRDLRAEEGVARLGLLGHQALDHVLEGESGIEEATKSLRSSSRRKNVRSFIWFRFENSFEFLTFSRNDLEIVTMHCLKINFDFFFAKRHAVLQEDWVAVKNNVKNIQVQL